MGNDQSSIRTVRVFVSSPSDVEFERQRVDRVAECLNHAFADCLQIKTVRWERRLYSSHASFQEQIPRAAECDLVIAVFWSRLGTPLSENFARMDSGERYPSGSAYEVLSALDARKKGDRPDVYVFRKTEPPADASEEAKGQRKDLNAFFSRWFQTPDGQFLRAYHRFRTPDEFEQLVDKLLRDWLAEHLPRDQNLLWPIETKGSPFRGLQPFDAKHAAIYFGRDRKVTRAIEQLQSVARVERTARAGPRSVAFLLIVGESGAGKSSLMRAGLAPRLTSPGVVPGVDLWRTAIVRVGDDPNPFLTLAKALTVARDEEHGFGSALPELRERGFASPEALAELLAQGAELGERRRRAPAAIPIIKALADIQAREQDRGGFGRRLRANLLLLIDQLENIFATDITDQQRSAFARLIFALAATRRVWIAATVRSDMYPRIITPGDFLALKDAGNVYDLAAPGESELTEIVHRSAAAAGLVYEKHPMTGELLDERILRDAQGKNTLPLLQFTLERLFQERAVVETGREIVGGRELVKSEVRLTHAAYDAMHGLDGAIDQTAEAALGKLGKAEIEALPRLLRCLAVPVHDLRSATTGSSDLTARMVPWAEAVPDAPTARLVKELTEARIIVTAGAGGQAGAYDAGLISVSHQRVFESWERARGIVAEHKEFFRIRDEVEAQRSRWQENGRPAALLLAKGVPLAEGQKIIKAYGKELSADMRAYVAASSRRAQRLNIIMGATAAAFAVLFVAAALFWVKAESAQQVAATNYDAAKGALSDLVGVITRGLQNIEGIRVQTVQSVLAIVDKTIRKVEAVSAEDPEISRIRGEMLFQIGKAFQKKEEHGEAVKAAAESLDVRSKLTHFDQWKSNPSVFTSTPGLWRWELSLSLEFVGDLFREEKDDQDARERFDSTLAVRSELVGENKDNDEWARGVSQIYTRIGDIEINSNLAAALRDYQGSLLIAAKYFQGRKEDPLWQRELTWAFNKVGDVRLKRGDAIPRTDDAAARTAEYAAALEAFGNGLCLRRLISAHEPANTELRRDIPYSLDRIGNAKLGLDDSEGAELAYFEALGIRRELVNSVPDDARYLGDVGMSLAAIGDYYFARNDLKRALAFYEAAVDVRLQVTVVSEKNDLARVVLTKVETRAADIRKQFLAVYPQEDPSSGWWEPLVKDAESENAKHRSAIAEDPNVCWDGVIASVEQIVVTTATIH
jgi:tetratricopeptide (TPR) repeat protein